MLWLTKRIIFGQTKNEEIKNLKDANRLEVLMLGTLAIFIVFFGFYPTPLMEAFNVSVDNLILNFNQDLDSFKLVKND